VSRAPTLYKGGEQGVFCIMQNPWPLAPFGPTYDPTAPAISLQSKQLNVTQFFHNTSEAPPQTDET